MSTINEIMEMIYRWEDAADDHLDGALFLTIKSAIDTKDAEIERLRARLAEIEAQEPMTDEQRAWARLGPLIEKHQIGISTPSNQVHRNGGPNAGWGKSGFWGGTAWMHGLERRPIAHGKSSALEAITELVAMIAAAGSPHDDQH